jgi:hypothetical protein
MFCGGLLGEQAPVGEWRNPVKGDRTVSLIHVKAEGHDSSFF